MPYSGGFSGIARSLLGRRRGDRAALCDKACLHLAAAAEVMSPSQFLLLAAFRIECEQSAREPARVPSQRGSLTR